MRSLCTFLLAGLIFTVGCSTEQDPNTLVAEADALLVNGGIEDAKTRALAEQKYDRAIRIICGGDTDTQCVKSGSGADPGSPAFALSHAHFGLAFARTFDLVERIRQLYASGTISRPTETAKVGDQADSDSEESVVVENQCENQTNLPQLVPLLKTIVDTSLLPIIADLRAVTNYPQFEVTYAKAFLDFSFLNIEATDPLGFEFGTDDNGMEAKFSVSEVYGMLAVYRIATVLAQGVFSFNDLTQALLVYLPKLDQGGDVNPYALARILNSDPCATNPLFNASFGVLTEAGNETFKDVEEQLNLLFTEQTDGFNFVESNPDDLRLFDYSGGANKKWASNFAGRIKTGDSTDDSTIKAVFAALTQSVPPKTLASMFGGLSVSLQQGTPFNFTAFVKGNDDLDDILTAAGVDIASLGLPAISFKLLFSNPVADLKSLAPLTYAESEQIVFNFSDGLPEVLGQEKPVGQEALNLWWTDKNLDAHFNQRGDFIVQTEREVFFDRANDNTPSSHQSDQMFDDGATDPTTKDPVDTTRGIMGAFWDYDRNGVPDDGFYDIIPGAGVSWARGAVAISAATDALYFSTGVTDESLTFRDYYDDKLSLYSNGCADYLPILAEDVDPSAEQISDEPVCTVHVGAILGHVWPSVFPELYAAPGKLDARRRDPANGVVDKVYMFYPNPSMNGALQATDGKAFRAFANQDFNRLVSSIMSLPDILNKIANPKD